MNPLATAFRTAWVLACVWSFGLAALVGLGGCGESSSSEKLGSNSNWLLLCSDDEQCGGSTSCECGACTTACESDADCGALANATCAIDDDPARSATCSEDDPSPPAGVCLPRCEPGGCETGQFCVGSSCVLAPLPRSDFCAAVTDWDAAERTREEELLRAYSELRLTGGISCGTEAPSDALPPLRFDPRLICSARVLASDLSVTGANTLVDSAGRTSQQRLTSAGYTPVSWAEAFAYRSSAGPALDEILLTNDACVQLVGAQHRDVGVGSIGGVMVITLGSE